MGIVEALEADIHAGRVACGDRLPSQRFIAEALNVDLTTVTRAFNEARRRGLVAAQPGRGTYVSKSGSDHPAPQPRSFIDLSMNIPPQPSSIDFRSIFPAGIAGVLEGASGLLNLSYQDSAGSERDRSAAATWMGARIEGVSSDRVVIASGAQCALFGICKLLLEKGDVIAAGAMTYPGLKAVAIQTGLRIVPVDMDLQGMVPDAFERVCRDHSPKLLYVIPSIDNPTTATLSEERRRSLSLIASKYNLKIIEDDPYAPIRPDRLTAFSELMPNSVWHISTLSKCATPAFRVAYILAPSPRDAQRLAAVLRASTLMSPPLMTALASRWIEEDFLTVVAQAISAENTIRQRLAATILKDLPINADPHGYHLWMPLPSQWRANEFSEHAEQIGVAIVPSEAFATVAHPIEAIRISLGVASDLHDLEDGLRLLVDALSQPSFGIKAVV